TLSVRLAKACHINSRQRGFIWAAGCSENLKLVQLLIQCANREHRELGVVFVTIAKAFDTVSHQHILTCLKQKGMDPHNINLISNMCDNIYTHIS
ncbi:POLR protein, partial [Sclerurus mexicanus]|nr:POLR protein [Sclerurus mexicanus]